MDDYNELIPDRLWGRWNEQERRWEFKAARERPNRIECFEVPDDEMQQILDYVVQA